MATRADRIFRILEEAGGRMRVADVRARLAEQEKVDPDYLLTTVAPTVSSDNKTKRQSGRRVRFNTYGDGTEEHGYVSLTEQVREQGSSDGFPEEYEKIQEFIDSANDATREKLRQEIAKLDWRVFESSFMIQVLEALGFTSIEVTQATRDGGVDARCFYSRGIVRSEACVSAKKWDAKRGVGPAVIREMLGVEGNHDTVIIFTTSSFNQGAKKAAAPQPRRPSVVLIDGDLIVDTCFREQIGVKRIDLPVLSTFERFEMEDDA